MDEVPGLSRAVLHRARISRDARFDGKFFIAVLTTGVYCRPVCPSPQSKKAHVRYYATAAAAAAAGYRPCRRCRPEVAPGSPAWLGSPAVVRRALRLIHQGALDEAPVEALALRLGIGSRHLHRLFATHVGVAPIVVAQTRRLHFAKQLLDETDLPVTQIAMTAGFGSVRRFNEAFRSAFHLSPRATRRRRSGAAGGAAEEEISLTLAYRPPYDWDALGGFLERRAIPGVERMDGSGYARTIRLERGAARIRVTPVSGQHALRLQVSGAQPSDLFEIAMTARRVFDLGADPAPIVAALAADPLLAALVARHPGIRMPGVWGGFECAVRAVLEQDAGPTQARALAGALTHRFGDRVAEAVDELQYVFPSAERLAGARLQSIGLTAAQVAAVRALARAVLGRRSPLALQADDLLEICNHLPGISRWAAQYVAMHAFGEPDAFCADDPVVRRALLGRRALGTIEAIQRRALAWRPWRSYAMLHLWQAMTETGRQLPAMRRPKTLGARRRRRRARPGSCPLGRALKR